MPRKPRIEYEGAVYHVMSRGDRKEPIFHSDEDHGLFLRTLGEACEQTGWNIHAWVLMKNHYHLLLETPRGNLIDGMKWLQGTYTQRFNATHHLSGHLFQGRYKALVVDQGDPHYFRCVAAYIHLNPARANLIRYDTEDLSAFKWSSYPAYLNVNQRPGWLVVKRLLGTYQQEDTPEGRNHFHLTMIKRCLDIQYADDPWLADEEWSNIRRGWCFGTETFKDEMLEKMDDVLAVTKEGSFSGKSIHDHSIKRAEQIVVCGLKALSLSEESLMQARKGDLRKKILAHAIKKETRVSNQWVAHRLGMGHPANLAKFCREIETSRSDEIMGMRAKLEKHLNTRTDPFGGGEVSI